MICSEVHCALLLGLNDKRFQTTNTNTHTLPPPAAPLLQALRGFLVSCCFLTLTRIAASHCSTYLLCSTPSKWVNKRARRRCPNSVEARHANHMLTLSLFFSLTKGLFIFIFHCVTDKNVRVALAAVAAGEKLSFSTSQGGSKRVIRRANTKTSSTHGDARSSGYYSNGEGTLRTADRRATDVSLDLRGKPSRSGSSVSTVIASPYLPRTLDMTSALEEEDENRDYIDVVRQKGLEESGHVSWHTQTIQLPLASLTLEPC